MESNGKPAVKRAHCTYNTYTLMTLYYCGWNGCGQSIGHSSIICEPIQLVFDAPIVSVSCSWSVLSVATEKTLTVMGFIGNSPNSSKIISLDDNSKAVQVSSTLNHTLIVTNNGKCYTYNSETDNLRKIVNFSTVETSQTNSEDAVEDPIINVSCGGHTNLALSKTGRVFAIPCLINLPKLKVTHVSCGNEHSILLTETGSVFTWGCSSRGQLGHGDLEPEERPRHVEVLSELEVHSISAGAWHNAVVTSTGDLYTWGWGSDGQLGVEEDQEEVREDESWEVKSIEKSITDPEKSEKYRGIVQTYPIPIDTPVDVHSVSCGSRHTLVLLVDGSVWGCGWNAYGQLAFPPTKFTRLITLKRLIIPALEKRITKIQCGAWSSCFVESLN